MAQAQRALPDSNLDDSYLVVVDVLDSRAGAGFWFADKPQRSNFFDDDPSFSIRFPVHSVRGRCGRDHVVQLFASNWGVDTHRRITDGGEPLY